MAKIGIFVGTVYGNALNVAEAVQAVLQAEHQVTIFAEADWSQWSDFRQEIALIVTSTTGQGELPANVADLFHAISEEAAPLSTLRYGIIALGDSSYALFCGAGKAFDRLLQHKGATRLGNMLFIDAEKDPEPEALALDWVEAWRRWLN